MTNNKKLHIPHVARTTGLSIGLVLTFLVCSFITSAEYQSTTDLPGGDAQQLRVPVVSGDWLASGKKKSDEHQLAVVAVLSYSEITPGHTLR